MATGCTKPSISPDDISRCHLAITDECRSSIGESSGGTSETGHERLIHKAPNKDSIGITHCRASRPPHYLYFAMLVALINFPFGGLAVVFSLLSKKSSAERDLETARTRGNTSKWLSIVGIAISAVIVAFLVVYFVYIDKNIVDTEQELRGE